ncbi:hypothetical protein CSIRO_0414 [Bradyrhizobiaceae bacterium SG-6C]|nr:hypothetical protein CSIRO_0414 [Bradyrhizobiaceae bacterium SG-6C]
MRARNENRSAHKCALFPSPNGMRIVSPMTFWIVSPHRF